VMFGRDFPRRTGQTRAIRAVLTRQLEGAVGLETTRWRMLAEGQMKVFGFTPTEQRVAWHLLQDMANKEISRALGITEHTVKDHLRVMYQKAQVRSRVGLVLALLQLIDNDYEPHHLLQRSRHRAA
jgi:DNA-binding CsgD family transcriptional regulator